MWGAVTNTGYNGMPTSLGIVLSCFNSGEELAGIRSSAGLPIWREDDTVHLTAAAYNDIAAVLSNQAENHGKQPVTGQVRRRLASVISAATAATPSGERAGLDQRRAEVRQRRHLRRTVWRFLRRAVGRSEVEPLERASPLPLLE